MRFILSLIFYFSFITSMPRGLSPFSVYFHWRGSAEKGRKILEKEDKAKRVHTYTHKRYLILVI